MLGVAPVFGEYTYIFYLDRKYTQYLCSAKAELVSSVYEKALKRKDITGTIAINQKGGKSDQKDGAQGEGDKASADVGKIVSLIATDTQKISEAISSTQGSFQVEPTMPGNVSSSSGRATVPLISVKILCSMARVQCR